MSFAVARISLKYVKMAELRTDRVKVNSSDAKQHHLGSRCKDQFLFSTYMRSKTPGATAVIEVRCFH